MHKYVLMFLSLIFLISLSCAHKTDYPSAMLSAEECIDSNPDSALAILSTLSDSISKAPEETQMYWRLLTVKAKDRLQTHHITDSIILPIVSYYKKTDDKEHLFEAYYYLGGAYCDMNDVPRALKAYHQAISIGEDTDMVSLLGMTYEQMGILFSYQGLYDESRRAIKKALHCYEELGNPVRYANTLCNMAHTYSDKRQKDSVLYYYKQSYRMACKLKNNKLADRIAGEMGCFYYYDGLKGLAKHTLLRVLPSKRKSSDVLLCLGCIYKDEDKVDSARYCFGEVLKHGDYRKRCNAYCYLSDLEKTHGNRALAETYNSRYLTMKDSISTVTQTDAIERLHLLYSFQHEEEKNHKLDLANEIYRKQIYLLAFVLMFSIALSIIAIQYVHSKKQKAIEQQKSLRLIQEEQYKQSLTYIRENERKLQEVERQLSEAGKQNDTLLQELLLSQKEVIESSNRRNVALMNNRELSERSFHQSSIFALFHNACHNKVNVTDENWRELIEALDRTYPNFTNHLYAIYPKLSDRELKVCCLIKSSLNYTEMANILICSLPTITNIRRRLYKKISGVEGTGEDLDKIVLDL